MTKFEKSLLLLAVLVLLGLTLVSRRAGRAVPLRQQPMEREPVAVGETFINTASAEELCALPGVGPVIAERIVALRPFDSAEELLAVEGIGEATLEKIYEYLEEN